MRCKAWCDRPTFPLTAIPSQWRASAAPCATGGLRKDTPAAGRLYGKSGAISRNFALAGYLEPPNYEPLAFSIFINNINARGSTARPIIDDIILQLADLEDCN